MANVSDGLTEEVINNLKVLFNKLDLIRDFFNAAIVVHVAYRPEAYNILVKGAKNSGHKYGKAVDFHVVGINCDDARQKLIDANKLEELSLRMEQNLNGTWIHLDTNEPHPNRYFKP